MNELKYLLDGEPVSARTLIDEAAYIDDTFAADWMKSTSAAASILRTKGQTVEDNSASEGRALDRQEKT